MLSSSSDSIPSLGKSNAIKLEPLSLVREGSVKQVEVASRDVIPTLEESESAPVLIGISGSSSMGGASRAREKKEFLREKGDEVTKEIIGNCLALSKLSMQAYSR
ncbi:MAG: hypothetical protein ACI9S8_002220 [Chlamydiales bacterium]|jgi:hypothetical protein